MKVVEKQLLFVRSADRIEGSVNDFNIIIPMDMIRIKENQFIRVTVSDIVVPRLWYNTRTNFNNQFAISIDVGVGIQWYIITVPDGCYSVDSFLTKLVGNNTGVDGILNIGFNQTDPVTGVNYWNPQPAVQQALFFMSYDEDNGKFKYNATQAPVAPIVNIQFDVFGQASGLTFQSCWALLGLSQTGGFPLPAIIPGLYSFPLAPPDTGDLYSDIIATVQTEEALYIRTNLPNWNVMRGDLAVGAPRNGWERGNILAHIPITTFPYSNITYLNMNDDYSILIPSTYIESMRFFVTDEFSNLLPLEGEYEMTLKFEKLEHTEREQTLLNEQQLEMLKTIVLQGELG
tara:strand:+ start:1327 stop:2361 length:1035 start_codon:yes stop_codon:yes gene_type:complete